MGILLKTEIETNVGVVKNAYITIPSYTVRKNTGEISFSVAYYTSEKYSKMGVAEYVEDIANLTQLPIDATFAPHQILCLENKEWVEKSLPQNLKVKFTKPKTTPILETTWVEEEIEMPYISFDEEGNEVEKVRIKTIPKEKTTKIGEVVKNKIDWSLVEHPLSFAYKHLAEELKNIIPNLQIEKA